MAEVVIHINDIDPLQLVGVENGRLNLIKSQHPCIKILSRGNQMKLFGGSTDVQLLHKKITFILSTLQQTKFITDEEFQDIIISNKHMLTLVEKKSHQTDGSSEDNFLLHGANGKMIKCRTPNQKKLVHLIEEHTITFVEGPAGTGKTYMAVAVAVKYLKEQKIKKIILTRPAVEAGENLGYLPGDLKEKIDPYLMPLYDALRDIVSAEKLRYYLSTGVIEVAPLAYMRGRTLNEACIILDEAQNTTSGQLKMFLTRLGPNAKVIVTGDLSQIDLPSNSQSGLKHTINMLRDIEGIGTMQLEKKDIARHKLVGTIIAAYEKLYNT